LQWYVAPLMLAVAAVSGLSIVAQAEKAPAAAAPHDITSPITPVLSARRVPEVIAAPVSDNRLIVQLNDLLTRTPDSRCLTVAVGGRMVFSERPNEPLIPASIEKLLTAQAVLSVFGPDAVLTTRTVATETPQNGQLNGNLWMVGGGDPLLMTNPYVQHFKHQPVTHSDLGALADRIVTAGITHITGSVVGDDSRYDTQRFLPQWPARFALTAEIGPLSALMVNDAFVEFPPTPDVRTPPVKLADDAAVHAADQLTQLLVAKGVRVDGAPTSGRAPDGSIDIAQLESVPIGQMVTAMLTESDNGTAELLTKELGVHDGGVGSTAAGVADVTKVLAAASLPLDGTTQFDGSGLATENRETCAVVQALLDQQGPTSLLAAGLPMAGQTGTLDKRFVDTPLVGRLRAKTGTLDQATALAGFLQTTQGSQVSFAFLMNARAPQKITQDDVDLEEELASILVKYPETVDVAKLGPKT
jgi:D-alanyl-D-alanine carboxypeptidase/D-alanyl-D-alanine-endopeptidase (penicillin-binding protein 4)